MNNQVIQISDLHLFFSLILVLIAGSVSALFKLGLLKTLIWGSFRTIIQLMLIGYVLKSVFSLNSIWIICLLLLIMCIIAARESVKRVKTIIVKNSFILSFFALTASMVLVSTIVCAIIIQPTPWYTPRVLIPVAGMILGNSMNGIALTLERILSESSIRSAEIETRLLLGATKWEAVRVVARSAIRSGMTPIINSLMVVGIVSLPGMMTGQILGGVDPMISVRYQIVVMFMITAAVAMGSLIIIAFTYSRIFTEEDALRKEFILS